MKKFISVLIVLSLCLTFLVSCGKAQEKVTETSESTTKEKITENVIAEEVSEEEWLDEEDYFAMYQPPETKTKTYITLEKELKAAVEKRGYTGKAKELVINTFNALYNCYSTWKVVYRDLPPTQEYIREAYINVFDHVEIKCYVNGSKKHKEFMKIEPSLASGSCMNPKDNGECEVIMILDDEEKTPYLTICDLETFFHEVTHCRAHYYVFTNPDLNYEASSLFVEGSATFHMKFTKKRNYQTGGGWVICKKDESVQLEYRKDNGAGYMTYLNAYEKLVYLLGYDTIFRYENGELTFENIKDKLSKKYGKSVGGKLFETMLDWNNAADENCASDEAFELSIDFENLFFECLKLDIEKIDTKEDAEEFIRIYDHYKKRTMPVTVNADGKRLPTVFDVASVDKELKIKAKEFGIKYI